MVRPFRHAACLAALLLGLLMARQVNAAAMAIANISEGCVLHAYKDPKGIWTAGYGHVGPDVLPGMVITQAQADAWRTSDMAAAAAFVDAHVHVALSDNQFGALADFAYNAGTGAFLASTLLRKLNKGLYSAVPAQLMLWNKVKQPDGTHKVLDGLTIRRQHEAALFMLPDTHTTRPVMVGTSQPTSGFSTAPTAVTTNAKPQPPTLLERLLAWWHGGDSAAGLTLTPS